MGIPHLISTIEPFANHGFLQDVRVVVDGPALAYHILHLCRVSGVEQPSYDCLGSCVVSWLDELSSRHVDIEAIFFDGHLPLAKRPVRMERCFKTTSQLAAIFSAHPGGYPQHHFSTDSPTSFDLFPHGRPAQMSRNAPTPSFLVPAIIDALKQSTTYGTLVRLVPGEADGYCADHVASRGGIVLTSDSDLLVHDLGDGQVAFLRDVYMAADSRIACATYSPTRICESLRFAHGGIRRLAYELLSFPNATLAQLVSCGKTPVQDMEDYDEFCQQYLHVGGRQPPLTNDDSFIPLHVLDPRVSELIIQLSEPSSNSAPDAVCVKMFLPHLIESSVRGSAWEPSTPIRQLAYTIARLLIPGSASSIQEYRRVQDPGQKGREVLLVDQAAAVDSITWLLDIMSRLRLLLHDKPDLFWPLLCLVLDIGECQRQEKRSHALHMIQTAENTTPSAPGGRIPWDVIHLAAHLQAGYYSFRILRQILSAVSATDSTLPGLSSLGTALLDLTPLTQYPDIHSTLDLLRPTVVTRLKQILLGDFALIPPELAPKRDHAPEDADKRRQKKKASKQRKKMKAIEDRARSLRSGTGGIAGKNSFSVLSVDL